MRESKVRPGAGSGNNLKEAGLRFIFLILHSIAFMRRSIGYTFLISFSPFPLLFDPAAWLSFSF